MSQIAVECSPIGETCLEETTQIFLDYVRTEMMRVDPQVDEISAFRRETKRLQLRHTNPVPTGVITETSEFVGRNGNIPVRIYSSENESKSKPTIVYFHGGGWVIGGLDEYDGICGYLAHFADTVVISIDYRLAPEHKFPTAVEDCYDAICWAFNNMASLGCDRTKLCVAGDSAGGNLAAVVSQLALQNNGPDIARQLLFYPCLAPLDVRKYPSRRIYGTPENFLNEQDFQHVLSQYVRAGSDELDARLWPSLSEDLSQLPDAYVVTAEFDMLRDEASDYAKRLSQSGVRVIEREYKGTIHGFMGFAGTILPGKKALDEVCAYLRNW